MREKLLAELKESFKGILNKEHISKLKFEKVKVEAFGDISTNIAFKLAKEQKRNPEKLAEEIVAKLSEKLNKEKTLIKKVEAKGGYINFFFDDKLLAKELLKEIFEKKENFGLPLAKEKKRIMVEHTSVNPNKALHIGHLRNSCLGDFIARFLKKLGNEVIITYYADDTGNQVADLIVGFKELGFPETSKEKKFDAYCGDEVYVKVNRLYEKKPELLEKRKEIMRKIEEGNNEIARYAKELSVKILKEQLKTLYIFKIYFDLINWESDILHSKLWEKVFSLLKKKEMVYKAEDGKNRGCWLIKLSELEQFKGMREADKILVRSDGTLLYVAKDIAYAFWKLGLIEDVFSYRVFEVQPNGKMLWETCLESKEEKTPKFNEVDVSINVIGAHQKYEQEVVKNAIRLFCKDKEYIHYSYELVSLSKRTARKIGIELENKEFLHLSGRKGIYINVDDIFEVLFNRIYKETKEKHLKEKEDFYREIAEKLAIGTLKFEMLKVAPERVLVFDLDDALNTEGFSCVYLMYSFVRCNSILKKVMEKLDFNDIEIEEMNEYEKKLIKKFLEYEEILEELSKKLCPHILCNYVFELCSTFNEFYHNCPVLKEREEKKRKFRLALVEVMRILLSNIFEILGIEKVEKM